MKNRAFTISLSAALLSVLLIYSFVNSTIDGARRELGEEVEVVYATRNIEELDSLDASNLGVKKVFQSYRQPGTSPSLDDFKGTIAIVPIMKGEQISSTKLTVAGLRGGLARQISPGKRAVTIRINDESGLAKLLKPGDRVDVAATVDPSGSGNKLYLEMRMIMQDRLVLAIGKYVNNSLPGILEVDPNKRTTRSRVALSEYMTYSTVTLEVDPHQVLPLVFAAKHLDVYLSLRNSDDSKVVEELDKAMMKDFYVRDPAGAPAPPKGPSAIPGKK